MGGGMEGIRQCDKIPEPLKRFAGTKEETKAVVAGHWLIRQFINRLPCSGNTPIWKDDESGASGGWDRVVRLYEDMA